MKKLKKYCLLTIIILFAISVIFLVPIAINESYKCDKDCYLTLWGASDVLAYSGAVLSLIGTVILGTLTCWQNKKAYDVSDRMLKIEEERMTPCLDIIRESSKITPCKNNNNLLKVALCVRNLGEYPIQNIYLSKTKLNKQEIERLYVKGEIEKTILEELKNLEGKEKDDEHYILTSVAGLRERTINHYKHRNGERIEEEEKMTFSEYLYFNINECEIDNPVECFVLMQNIVGKIFVQKTKLYIVQRNQDKKYVLTMHSKQIESIELKIV